MATAIPVLCLLDIDQPDIGLMHQRRRLQRLSGFLLSQFRRRQFPQFVVDQRQELLGGRGITGFDLDKICVTSVMTPIIPSAICPLSQASVGNHDRGRQPDMRCPNTLVFRLLLTASPLAIKSSGCDIPKPMLEFKVRDCHQSGSFLTSPDIGIW